ncbi:MAG: DUF6531 domain-containing protein [Acidimicrobiales bacterium]
MLRKAATCAVALVVVSALGVPLAALSAAPALASGGGLGTSTTWVTDTYVPALVQLVAISCPATDHCVAVGESSGDLGGVIETTNGGSSWSPDSLPQGTPALSAVSCSSSGTCAAVGGSSQGSPGTLLYQSSPGQAFAAVAVPSGVGEVTAIACAAGSSTCFAVSYDISDNLVQYVLASGDGGATWSIANTISLPGGSVADFSAMSCVTTAICDMTDGGGEFAWTSNSWSSYTTELVSGPGDGTGGISCPTTSYCLAGGPYDLYTGTATDDSWSEAPKPSTISDVSGVMCSASSTCGLVGDIEVADDARPLSSSREISHGRIFTQVKPHIVALGYYLAITTTTDGGQSWDENVVPSGLGNDDNGLGGLSCEPSSTCFAVGEAGGEAIVLDNGGVSSLFYPEGGRVPPSYMFGGNNSAAPGTCQCAGQTKDPVDVATGDFYQSHTDISVPTFGPPLSFTRSYDAGLAQAEASTSSPGPLGYGWSDNMQMSLSGIGTSNLVVSEGSGAEVSFSPEQNGVCSAPDVVAGGYCALPEVLASLSYDSSTETYAFVTHPETTYTFNSAGELVSITDANGASVSFDYDAPAPGQGSCPSAASTCEEVTSAGGRSIVIASNASGQVTSVTGPMGRTWTYAYSAAGDLISATDPMGRVTTYGYDSSDTDPDLRHDLVSVSSPNAQLGGPDAGKSLELTYDSSGRILSEVDPLGRSTTFDYSGMDTTTGSGDVIVTDPDGNETNYAYGGNVLVQKTVGYGTSSPSTWTYNPDPASLLDDSVTNPDGDTTTYAYDQDGNLVSLTNPLGNTWTYAYNLLDEQTCSTEPLAAETCSQLSPPGPVSVPVSTVSPPASVPPAYVTYTEYDSKGNELWQAEGAYPPGSDAASSRSRPTSSTTASRPRSAPRSTPALRAPRRPSSPVRGSTPAAQSPSSPTTQPETSPRLLCPTGTRPSSRRRPVPTTLLVK